MKTRITALLLLAVAADLWAQSPRARIENLQGTVEIRLPGSTAWQSAVSGQELEQETMVSTGFKSAALIRVGNSAIQVRPLTRLTIREIRAAADADSVEIQLRAGRIRADVKPPAEGAIDFSVRSPMATASVRGTVFDFDTVNLAVNEGTVAFSGADNTAVYVAAGQSSSPDPLSGRSAVPVETAATVAPPPPAGVESSAPQPPAVIPGPAAQAPVTVTIDWE